MKNRFIKWHTILLLLFCCGETFAQQGISMYGDKAKADVKMNYVYSMEEALKQAHLQKKPIFFNCFADWAIPCHTMDQEVFSNQAFCDYMDKHFVNLFMDVTQKNAAALVKKYQIKGFAQYLVLDENGNILLRIMGGKVLPEFQECVALALSPKTSLAGTEQTYQSGKYGKKELLNYLNALHLAGEYERFKQIAQEYFPLLKEKEYSRKENWEVFSLLVNNRNSDLYNYLIHHKSEFIHHVGEKPVVTFIESCFYTDIYRYAAGKTEYEGIQMLDLYNEMIAAELPDSCIIYKLYHIAKLRGEKKYEELFKYMEEQGKALGLVKFEIDMSFEFTDLNDEQKLALANYLHTSAQTLPDHLKRQMESLANQVVSNKHGGINFELLKFNEALAKAKETHKLVFIDCYTSWCGPCRSMDNNVFPLPEVGELFNHRFVNIKKDMEKGEGIELAKRYNVSAFPTMMILDENGQIVQRIVGGRSKERLMKIAAEANPATGYTVSKEAYAKGIRTGKVIKGYVHALREAQELNDQSMKEMIDSFFVQTTDRQFCDSLTWPLIESDVTDVHSPEFTRLLSLHDELCEQNGTQAVNQKIESVALPYVARFFRSEISEKEAMEILTPISNGHYPANYPLTLLAQMIPLSRKNNPQAVLDFYEQKIKPMASAEDRAKIDNVITPLLDKLRSSQQ